MVMYVLRQGLRIPCLGFFLTLLFLPLLNIWLSNFVRTANVKSVPQQFTTALQTDWRWNQNLSNDMFLLFAANILEDNEPIGKTLDIHLFVIWHIAYPWRKVILRDIENSFIILRLAEFDWGDTPNGYGKMLANLWVLYSGKGGWNRTGMARKVDQCGMGKFTAVVVADMKPHYVLGKTAHGVDTVNKIMHAKKSLYRLWSGGGFGVHGTFSTHEANHDIRLLFHVTLPEILREAIATRSYARGLVSEYFNDRSSFATALEVYGFAYAKGSQQAGWQCASFLFALCVMTQVRVKDGMTGRVLWTWNTSPQGQPFASNITVQSPCVAWPEMMLIQVPSSEMWGLLSLLHATPLAEGEITLRSKFVIHLEGSARELQLESCK